MADRMDPFMRIGLLADTHGKAGTARRAVELLIAHGAEMLIHLGDVGGIEVVDAMAGEWPVHIVFGNTDDDAGEVGRYATLLGMHVHEPAGRIVVDGKTIVFTHGHWPDVMNAALAGHADFLLHGHTHKVRDESVGNTRVINPGALCRTAVYTVGLLDVETGRLETIEVPSGLG